MTLVEMVLAVTISGFIMSSIAMSIIVMMRSDAPTSDRLTEAKDVAFLQTYLPVDYSSAITRDVTPTLQPIAGVPLEGTNVLTLYREQGSVNMITSYRYEQQGSEWQLVRYEYGNPDNGGALSRTIVAHQLAAPPPEWTADQSPVHAVAVNARNQTVVRPVGDDMLLTFKSGNTFSTGGSGLSSNTELDDDYAGAADDPITIGSRCGGRVTLILDVSTSISWANAEQQVRDAALGFVDAFKGTPSDLSIIKFSDSSSPVYPGSYGNYFSVLDPASSEVTAGRNAINSLWFNGSTNWEAPLYNAVKGGWWGTPHALQPELVVLVTDGDPNEVMNHPYNWNYWSDSQRMSYATTQAATRANDARSYGARVIGILVGNASLDSSSVGRLKQVVGSTAWNGSVAANGTVDVGNAANADYFIAPGGDFSELGGVLRAVAAGECGGTITIQKKIDTGGGTLVDSTKTWTYTTDVGVRELNPNVAAAITFDFTFADGAGQQDVQVVEQPNSGYKYDRVECKTAGVALPSGRVQAAPNNEPGVVVTIKPNEAVSCTFISKPS